MKKNSFRPLSVVLKIALGVFAVGPLHATGSFLVTLNTDNASNTGGAGSGSSGDLRYVINQINATYLTSSDTIDITFATGAGNNIIYLNAILPPINLIQGNTILLDGTNQSDLSPTNIAIDGSSSGTPTYRGLYVMQGNVTISNLTIQNCSAQGGVGSGGGAGLGGGLYVQSGTVNLSSVVFDHNYATGGVGTGALGQGGGGIGGNGGTVDPGSPSGGGGGGYSGDGGGSSNPYSGGGGGGGFDDGGDSTSTRTTGSFYAGGGGGGGGILGMSTGGIGIDADDPPACSGVGAFQVCSYTTPCYLFGGGGGGDSDANNGGFGPNDTYCRGSSCDPGNGQFGGGDGGDSNNSPNNAQSGGGGGAGGGGTDTTAGGGGGGGGGGAPGASGGSLAHGGWPGNSVSSFPIGGGGGSGGTGGGGGGGGGTQLATSMAGSLGGTGGYGGGGGAAGGSNLGTNYAAGSGGMGGGGGGGSAVDTSPPTGMSGFGGFGGGAGGYYTLTTWNGGSSATPGPGGGNNCVSGLVTGGGGGAGLGNHIFVDANSGAVLNIGDAVVLNANGASTGGFGACGATTQGAGASGLFIMTPSVGGAQSLNFNLTGTMTVDIPIGDDSSNTLPGGSYQAGNGNGSPLQLNGGTLILAGTNTYMGGTTISTGTLALSGGGNLPVGGNVINNDALDISEGPSSQTIGDLSGSGTTNLGSNTLTLGTSSGSTYSGTITGNGSLIKQGIDGVFVVEGSLSYTGGTTISIGTLQIGSGGNLPVGGNVINNDVLDISEGPSSQTIGDLSGSGTTNLGSNTLTLGTSSGSTYSGTITGNGSLIKQGSGTFILGGNNSYTGLTTISEGRLSVNGQVSGGVAVNVNGTLGGVGIIAGGGTIEGTLSPGNSIGTITFDTSSGNATLTSSSITNIEIDPSTSSGILVTGSGSVTLGGTLHVIQDLGAYGTSHEYTILSGSYIGEFAAITGGLDGYDFGLTYDSDFVYLFYPKSVPKPSQISTSGLSGNALKIANYLNKNSRSSTIGLFADLSESALQRAMSSISPARNAFGTYASQQTAFSLSTVIMRHLDILRTEEDFSSENTFMAALFADASNRVQVPVKNHTSKNKFSGWVSGFGEYANQKAELQNPSFHYTSAAALGGLDYRGDNRGVAGGTLGYAHTYFDEHDQAGHGNIDYYFTSVYGEVFAGNFYFSPAVWGIFNETKNTRNIAFPGFSGKAKANIFAWQLLPHLELGYDFKLSWGDIIPFSAVDWAITWQRGYHEHGATPFNASSKARSNSMVRSETGLKFSEKWEYSWGAFFLKEKGSYVFQKPFGTGTVTTAFTGIPSTFTVSAVNQDLNLGNIGVDFSIAIGKDKPTSINLGYEGEFGSNYKSNQLMLTFRKDF